MAFLNLGKIRCIAFGLTKITKFQIQCNYHIIKLQTELTYLGKDIERNLSVEITVNSKLCILDNLCTVKQAIGQPKLPNLSKQL